MSCRIAALAFRRTDRKAQLFHPETLVRYILLPSARFRRNLRFMTGRQHMMLDWNEYHKELGARIGELAKLSPDTVRGYQTLSAANSKTGKLDEKTRQLISLP